MNSLIESAQHRRRPAGREDQGLAIVELALVLPVLVFFTFGAYEFSRALQTRQIASALSREVASVAYREAAADPAGDPRSNWPYSPQQMQDRLTKARDDVQASARQLIPGLQLHVTLYRTNGTAYSQFSAALSGPHASRFSRTGSNVVGPLGASYTLKQRNYLVAGEAYIPYRSLFTFIWRAFGTDPQVFYDATVL